LLVALAVGAAYSLALRSAPDRIPMASFGDENKIRDEDFMCLAKAPDVVIAGSSLAARLGPMQANWTNLAQISGSPLTGLELVYRREQRPRIVLIESNVFGYASRGLKTDLIEEVTFPGVEKWRCQHRILQHKYRPVDVLLSLPGALKRALRPHSAGEPTEPVPASETLVDPVETAAQRADRLDGIRVQLADQAKYLSVEALDSQMKLALSRCRELARAGTECVFFELPSDPAVSTSQLSNQFRARMQSAAAAANVRWLPWIDPGSVRTSDGLHMIHSSAMRVTAQLESWIAAPPTSKSSIAAQSPPR
jgi:hypothetical protein